MNFTIVTNEDPLVAPELIIHDDDGDTVVTQINSFSYKYAKKGRGKGSTVIVNLTVPGVVDGEPRVGPTNFTLPQDVELVKKAAAFWQDGGIDLTPKTRTKKVKTTETVTVSAP